METLVTYKPPIQYKQIVHTWMYGGMDIEDIVKSINRIGLDGADLSVSSTDAHNHISLFEQKNLKQIFSDSSVEINIVSAQMFAQNTDLSSNDPTVRDNAIDFVKRVIKLSAKVECQRMLVVPSWISTDHHYYISWEEDWKAAVDSLRTLAAFAAPYGVTLMIEPVNRYRVGLVRTIAEATRMALEIDMPNIAIVPDTFHMNIEESISIPAALAQGGSLIKALHVGENNRHAPGLGALNWMEILRTLGDIGFDGCLSHEPFSLNFDENKVAVDPNYLLAFEKELAASVIFLKNCMETAAAAR